MWKIRLESSSVRCPGQFTLNCFLGSAGWKWKRTVELTTCFLQMERGETKAWEQSLSFNSFVQLMIWINRVITAALRCTINIINHISTTSSNLWRGTVQEACRHQLLDHFSNEYQSSASLALVLLAIKLAIKAFSQPQPPMLFRGNKLTSFYWFHTFLGLTKSNFNHMKIRQWMSA